MADTSPRHPVLVVEDDEHVAQLLKFMLVRNGFDVHLAADGRQGKQLIETLPPPACALLDVMLPFHDGFQLVNLLRARPGWERVPVIMLTAKTQERDVVRGLESGADDYVVKPFQPNELLARLRRLVRTAP
jgi:DNA-binding response OmpR family regulator